MDKNEDEGWMRMRMSDGWMSDGWMRMRMSDGWMRMRMRGG